jgi:proteasome lid subunit RPN8/RPN11
VISLFSDALDAIRRHGAEAYPEECCGALLGSLDSENARVDLVERLTNSREGDRRRRYVVSPQEYLRAERLASEAGLALVGFYHSHPDHPAVPSEYDREHALPVFHYVVLAVAAGTPGEASAWILSPDRGVFEREPIVSKQLGGNS